MKHGRQRARPRRALISATENARGVEPERQVGAARAAHAGARAVIAIALSLLSPYFLKTNNLLNLLDQSVVVGIVAIGMTFVILTGGIDLSVGSLAA